MEKKIENTNYTHTDKKRKAQYSRTKATAAVDDDDDERLRKKKRNDWQRGKKTKKKKKRGLSNKVSPLLT